jgi:alkanesulfonate monooxygenase SsuD/methylene tetrahydromethanopterin reductase-like flavin-dependent oxidoreductase (luciferase family)
MAADNPLRGTALAIAGSTIHRVFSEDVRVPMSFEDLAQAVTLAEDTGYQAVFVPDHGVWDPFALLAAFAHRTSRLNLATGVVTVATRTAEAMIAGAATVQRVSDGRAVLGVGSGPERNVERVSQVIGDVGTRLPDGIPVYLAALGPRMVAAAGGVADGVLLNWCPPSRVRRAREQLERTARPVVEVGHDPPPVNVAVYVRACFGHDEEHAVAALREAVATYAAIPTYRAQLEAEGLGRAADAAAEAHDRGRIDQVPVELVDALCVRGGRDQALARLEEYRAAGADLVVVYPVTAQEPVSSLLGTIMAAAPDPSVEA